MSDSKELYRRESEKQQAEMSKMLGADPTDRTNEIAPCRVLIGEALESGNVSTANSLLTTLDRLQKNEFARAVRFHKLLSAGAVKRAMLRISDEAVDVMQKYLPDETWQDAALELADAVGDILQNELFNTQPEIESVKLPK